MKFFRILALSAVICANIGAMESDINPLDSEQQNLALNIKKLPKDMSKEVAKLYFDKLIKRTDFKSEQDLIDTLNTFNAANKATNEAVKDYLKNKEKIDPEYKKLIVPGNSTKTFAKQFTRLKWDLIDNLISEVYTEDISAVESVEAYRIDIALKILSFVKRFGAFNWLKYLLQEQNNLVKSFILKNISVIDNDDLEMLLKAGLNPNIIDYRAGYGNTKFLASVISNYDSQKLIFHTICLHAIYDYKNSGIDHNSREKKAYEAAQDYIKRVKLLLKYGTDPNFVLQSGLPLLSFISLNNYIELIKYFFEDAKIKADPNIQDQNGRTPLHYTIMSMHKLTNFMPATVDILKILLKNGADTKLKDRNGESALDYANKFLKERESELWNNMSMVDKTNWQLGRSNTLSNDSNVKSLKEIIELLKKYKG